MKQPIFTGSGAAIITPFTSETVDYPALRRLIDFQLLGKTDAIIVCGTTGEAATMSYVERMRAIETTVRHVDGRVPVIAGTGSNSTENAITLSKDAALAGVDGLLVVTPYYNKATQLGLVHHYYAIADAVGLPLIVYHVPSRTGAGPAPQHCRRQGGQWEFRPHPENPGAVPGGLLPLVRQRRGHRRRVPPGRQGRDLRRR